MSPSRTNRAPRGPGLQGTTQNDIIKEYLSRGSYVFPPEASLRLTKDLILWSAREAPKFNPMNVCSYHLQEAGATPVQELSYALATAVAVLDRVRASSEVDETTFADVVGAISFFVNAGMRFVTELCKMRAFVDLWEEIARDRYGVTDPSKRRFRYGVQVNSLGLTEQQPENNAYRILIEMLSVVLSKRARARAVQLPAWNEALGLPRPFDQQWSLRLQQIMAYETDLLEFGDLFDGSKEIEAKVEALKAEARAELAAIDAMGGAVKAIESGYLKEKLVESNTARLEAIEKAEQIVVGVNAFTNTDPSPLTAGEGLIYTPSTRAETDQIERLQAWRAERDAAAVEAALRDLRAAAARRENIMPASIAAAKAGVTTGEWGAALRGEFGEYRAPTGVRAQARQGDHDLDELRAEVQRVSLKLGRRLKFLVGKPGLDGHSNGAEQIAVRATDAGMDVVYDGIRLTPDEIVERAKSGVHCVGLSILSGSHVAMTREVLAKLKAAGLSNVPVVVGGIIPPEDAVMLKAGGDRGGLYAEGFRDQCDYQGCRGGGGKDVGLKGFLHGVSHQACVGFTSLYVMAGLVPAIHADPRRRGRGSTPPHCTIVIASEAKQSSHGAQPPRQTIHQARGLTAPTKHRRNMDCFASLAMTVLRRRRTL